MNEMRIVREYRDARVMAFSGGTGEIMYEIIAKMEGL
jgi:alkylation response protein AidB-like acyl-CoA dehydrogenase